MQVQIRLREVREHVGSGYGLGWERVGSRLGEGWERVGCWLPVGSWLEAGWEWIGSGLGAFGNGLRACLEQRMGVVEG